jgi:hypothetical protein
LSRRALRSHFCRPYTTNGASAHGGRKGRAVTYLASLPNVSTCTVPKSQSPSSGGPARMAGERPLPFAR